MSEELSGSALNGAETKELMSVTWGGAYIGTTQVTSGVDNAYNAEPFSATTYRVTAQDFPDPV